MLSNLINRLLQRPTKMSIRDFHVKHLGPYRHPSTTTEALLSADRCIVALRTELRTLRAKVAEIDPTYTPPDPWSEPRWVIESYAHLMKD